MPKKPIRQRPPNPAKIKDMVESILPSTARGRKVAFYYKRMERRRVRHSVRYNLRSCDREGYTDKDLFLKPYQTENVAQRRFSDKVNPFIRWATRKTHFMPDKEALLYIKALLPRNLIGEHAYSHWKFAPRFRRKFSQQNLNKRADNSPPNQANMAEHS